MGDSNLIPTSAVNNRPFSIYYLSEHAVTMEFGNSIHTDTLQQVSLFNDLISQNPFPGFRTTVPSYTTLSICFDPLQVSACAELPGKGSFAKVSGYLTGLKYTGLTEMAGAYQTITIPVCYGGDFGPDLNEVVQLHQLTPQQMIELHSEAVYKVYMMGFVPGFAYLGGMNEILESPRKAMPRSSVPAGSVGIAGKQTGIYPFATPGGWQIIGQTPLQLFDAGRQQPSLLKAGDKVIFKPISRDEFNRLTHQ
ncbi:MAG: 5-oxoprolinase subunit PxpB [Mucilaginibacter sp.]